MLCYHEEYFALGFLSALFIFVIITLFEDAVKEFFVKVKELFN